MILLSQYGSKVLTEGAEGKRERFDASEYGICMKRAGISGCQLKVDRAFVAWGLPPSESFRGERRTWVLEVAIEMGDKIAILFSLFLKKP